MVPGSPSMKCCTWLKQEGPPTLPSHSESVCGSPQARVRDLRITPFRSTQWMIFCTTHISPQHTPALWYRALVRYFGLLHMSRPYVEQIYHGTKRNGAGPATTSQRVLSKWRYVALLAPPHTTLTPLTTHSCTRAVSRI